MAGYKRNRGGDAWQLIVTIGSDFTGKPKRYTKTVHCKTEAAADKELTRFWAECESGFVNTSKPTTVNDLCGIYLNSYCEKHHKESSLRSDRTAINIWIQPLLGKKKVNKLSTYDVQQWVDYLIDQKKSPKTIRNYYSVLRSMLDYAIKILKIINSNPCENVTLPSKEKKEMKSYNSDELKQLIKALDNLPENQLKYKCCILLALFGGFRKGEILGFDWCDFDDDTNTLTVRQTRMIAPKKGVYIDTPKTDKSNRDVMIPDFVAAELRKLKIQQMEDKLKTGKYHVDSPALIKSEYGDALYPQVLQRWFTNFCRNNNLPAYGLHSLRHTHASLLASIGADKVAVSTRLGHSQISTTLSIYTHLFENRDESITSLLNEYASKLKEQA